MTPLTVKSLIVVSPRTATVVEDCEGPVAECETPEMAKWLCDILNAHNGLVAALRLAETAIDDCHQYRSHHHHQTLGTIRDLIVKMEGRS